MGNHATKEHSLSACRKTGLEFRQIDDIRWLDFEFATVSRRLKSPTHLTLRITPGQRGAEKSFAAADFHSGTTAPLQPPTIVHLPAFAIKNPTTTHRATKTEQGETHWVTYPLIGNLDYIVKQHERRKMEDELPNQGEDESEINAANPPAGVEKTAVSENAINEKGDSKAKMPDESASANDNSIKNRETDIQDSAEENSPFLPANKNGTEDESRQETQNQNEKTTRKRPKKKPLSLRNSEQKRSARLPSSQSWSLPRS